MTGMSTASMQLTLSHSPENANFCVSSSIPAVDGQEGRGPGEQGMASLTSQPDLLLDAAGYVVSRAEFW